VDSKDTSVYYFDDDDNHDHDDNGKNDAERGLNSQHNEGRAVHCWVLGDI
jgi:hypothetical protein